MYSLIGRPALPYLILSRIVLIPIIAGRRLRADPARGEAHGQALGAQAMVPGLTLQKLTTASRRSTSSRSPSPSLRAVFTAEQTEEVDARIAA